jgi:hypothetical protein
VVARQETASFRYNRHGKPYLVRRTKVGKRREEQWIPLDEIDRKTLETALQVKAEVEDEIIDVPCTNPHCKNTVRMTKKQYGEFFVSSTKRYNIVIFPFCKPECRDAMLAQHGGTIDGSDQS